MATVDVAGGYFHSTIKRYPLGDITWTMVASAVYPVSEEEGRWLSNIYDNRYCYISE